MDQEIDDIFLNTKEPVADETKIENLKECANKIPTLFPYADLVLDQVEELRKYFSVYDIQLDALAKDLESIQNRNKALEMKNKNENAVYNHLKDLCIALSMDEGHFYILENGSFTDVSDLAKMEKSLAILGSVDLEHYKLRIVKDKMTEIRNNQRNFLKRFVTFLGKLLVQSESSGELRVHRKLYKSMGQYKFIYLFSKKYDDYYSILCSAYLSHSKKMYEYEFERHLESIYELVNDSEKLHICFEVLTKSYESLINCETDFIKMMEINVSVEEIFDNISSKIIEFIGDMFKKSRLATLVSIGILLNANKRNSPTYESFSNNLMKRYDVLEDLYLKSEKELGLDFTRIERLNFVLTNECLESFKNKYSAVWVGKLKINDKKDKANEGIEKLQFLYSIESSKEDIKKAVDVAESRIPRIVISYVFSSEDEVARIKSLINLVDKNKGGAVAIMKLIHSIIMEHAPADKRDQYEEVFATNRVDLSLK